MYGKTKLICHQRRKRVTGLVLYCMH